MKWRILPKLAYGALQPSGKLLFNESAFEIQGSVLLVFLPDTDARIIILKWYQSLKKKQLPDT